MIEGWFSKPSKWNVIERGIVVPLISHRLVIVCPSSVSGYNSERITESDKDRYNVCLKASLVSFCRNHFFGQGVADYLSL